MSDQFVQNLISLLASAFPKDMNDEQLDKFIKDFFNREDDIPDGVVEEMKKRYKELSVD